MLMSIDSENTKPEIYVLGCNPKKQRLISFVSYMDNAVYDYCDYLTCQPLFIILCFLVLSSVKVHM
ncbi:unnamed protein product [Thelazia callipaeda]|uniref:MTTase N-terminal domain-containing protein n=1 Tax=Thelazia callipaeda TaxID=103827 RepID=A0A0N5CTQ9_THECL|nr:unnamed protein product [Thelazia callipaeda]